MMATGTHQPVMSQKIARQRTSMLLRGGPSLPVSTAVKNEARRRGGAIVRVEEQCLVRHHAVIVVPAVGHTVADVVGEPCERRSCSAFTNA